MSITLTEQYTASNVYYSTNKCRWYPTILRTEDEVYLIREAVNAGDSIDIRKVNSANGQFESVFSGNLKIDNKDIVGIAYIQKQRLSKPNEEITIWASSNEQMLEYGYIGYYIGFWVWNGSDVDIVVYWTDDLSEPQKVKLAYYSGIHWIYWNRYGDRIIVNIQGGNDSSAYSFGNPSVGDNNFLLKNEWSENINVTYSTTFNSSTYTIFDKMYLASFGIDWNRRSGWGEYWINSNNNKIMIKFTSPVFAGNSGMQYTSAFEIWDGSYTSVDFTTIRDNFNSMLAIQRPLIGNEDVGIYGAPAYFYTPFVSNYWSTPASNGKTGIYSMTTRNNTSDDLTQGQNWTLYLLYSYAFPYGIIGYQIIDKDIYIVYRPYNQNQVIVYKQTGYWVDDQQSHLDEAKPYYKEIEFNPNNFEQITTPIAIDSDAYVFGGLEFVGGKLVLNLNKV